MSINVTFAPKQGSNTGPTATLATASVELGEGSKALLATNDGSETVYIRTGLSTVEATIADYPVLSGSQVTISKPQDDAYVAYFSALAGSIQIMAGEGF